MEPIAWDLVCGREGGSEQVSKHAVYVLLGVGLGPIVEGMARVWGGSWGRDKG
jgi:hypothetical protein